LKSLSYMTNIFCHYVTKSASRVFVNRKEDLERFQFKPSQKNANPNTNTSNV